MKRIIALLILGAFAFSIGSVPHVQAKEIVHKESKMNIHFSGFGLHFIASDILTMPELNFAPNSNFCLVVMPGMVSAPLEMSNGPPNR